EAVYKELDDSLVWAITTTSSLEAEQDSGNINKTQSKATPNESSSQGTNSGGGPWYQETMGDTIAQTSSHDVNVSTGEEVFATIVDDITLAQVLKEMKSTKPKKKGVVIQELGESTTTISSQLSSQQSHDKGKGILIELVKPMNKKDLIRPLMKKKDLQERKLKKKKKPILP
ncbi:hypothetical protein Tco_1414646, partial [Tanacetum coccineum]